jgi:membrane protease YdiL (CAAX protease family)
LESPPARQLPVPTLVVLFLLPGALGTLAYVALAGPVQSAGYPALAALLLAITFVILPVELALLLVARSRARASGEPLIPYRVPMPARSWAWLVPTLLAAAVAGTAILSPLDAAILQGLFSWLPDWYQKPIDVSAVGRYSRAAWIVTLAAYMVLNGFAGPAVEELYFRGWLLPRMARFGRWAPLLNAALFSLYHFWLPAQFFTRLAAVAPLIYAVRWRRNIYLGMAVHVLLNTIGGGLLVAQVAGRL